MQYLFTIIDFKQLLLTFIVHNNTCHAAIVHNKRYHAVIVYEIKYVVYNDKYPETLEHKCENFQVIQL